ncbi:hypothetical protein PUV54_14220 [Hyphococcus flavus]|uniref:Uncharacterized protein n=1 Tax=Hyphococcus flavus TaxID=1866326 RepID=A0AAF0CGU0_9PROT|nr:hypothetical protein [Hyphococcus flavus]WDI31107.1 hypothetical protein PUV54_14220 [Hyphococcus flavus]
MNKVLIGAVAFQTVLIIVLSLRFGGLEAKTNQIETTLAAIEESQPGAREMTQPRMSGSPSGAGLSAEEMEEIRWIMREEIDAVTAAMEKNTITASAATAPARDMPQDERNRLYQEFEQELSIFMAGSGALSQGDMASIEKKIAGLPPRERAMALSRYSKALSDGSLKGQL